MRLPEAHWCTPRDAFLRGDPPNLTLNNARDYPWAWLRGCTGTGTWTRLALLAAQPSSRRRDRGREAWGRGPQGPGQQPRRPPGAALEAVSGLAPTCPHAESAQVWRTATAKFAASLRAEAPEANYRRRPGQAIDLSQYT